MHAQKAQVLHHALAHAGGIFTYATCEHQCIQAACSHGHGSNVFGQAVGKHVQGQNGAIVSQGCVFFQSATIVRQFRNAE